MKLLIVALLVGSSAQVSAKKLPSGDQHAYPVGQVGSQANLNLGESSERKTKELAETILGHPEEKRADKIPEASSSSIPEIDLLEYEYDY